MREGCHHHNIPIGQGLKTLNELYFYHQQEKLESYRVVDCVDFKFIVRGLPSYSCSARFMHNCLSCA